MAVYEAIRNLVQYGVNTGLLQESDRIYATNQILEVLGLDEYEEPQGACREISLEETLDALLDYAHETGVLKEDGVVYRDLFDTKLMNCLMPRPSEVVKKFHGEYEKSPEDATAYFYKLSQDSDYIRRYRVCKDLKWITKTEYGDLDITVNLSKPEKLLFIKSYEDIYKGLILSDLKIYPYEIKEKNINVLSNTALGKYLKANSKANIIEKNKLEELTKDDLKNFQKLFNVINNIIPNSNDTQEEIKE